MAKGKKTGGRRKGSLNKKPSKDTLAAQVAEKAAEAGLMPLDYMLNRLRDEKADPAERMDAAKAAAPYVHRRLVATDLTTDGKPLPTSVVQNIYAGPKPAA